MHQKVLVTGEDASNEAVWMIPLGGLAFQVDNIPLISYNLSLGDVVEVEEEAGHLYVSRIVRKSGQRTLRVIVESEGGIRGEEGCRIAQALQRQGCEFEGLPPLLLAFDVPPQADLEAILSVLQNAGVAWEYSDPQPAIRNYYLR